MNLWSTQATVLLLMQYILFAVHLLSGNYYHLSVQKHENWRKGESIKWILVTSVLEYFDFNLAEAGPQHHYMISEYFGNVFN